MLALGLWADSESADPETHNPLGAVEDWPGAVHHPKSGVVTYPGLAAGIGATARGLYRPNMAAVLEALHQDAGAGPLYHAINLSGWCPRCQGGRYPLALYLYLHERGPEPGPQLAPSGPTAIPAKFGGGGGGGGGPVPKPRPPTSPKNPVPAWRYFTEIYGLTLPAVAHRLNAIARRPHR